MNCLGSAAAAAQASIGNIAAGSILAVLQSAGAGGAGLAVVNGVVGTGATVVAVGAAAPGLVKAAREGKQGDNPDGETDGVHEEEGKKATDGDEELKAKL
jgi:hypothetical protein